MKICPNCAKQNRDDVKYCTNCGYSLAAAVIKENPQPTATKTMTQEERAFFQKAAQQTYVPPLAGITQRNVALAIVLAIATCGLYNLYWMARLNDDVNDLVNDVSAPSGAMVVLFSFLSCGIYAIYWYYKMGEKVDYLKGTGSDSKLLYLIFSMFGLGIVANAIMQDEINKQVG